MEREQRKEEFIKWFGNSVLIDDCDPALYMTNYFFRRFEFNKEQKLWLCWLYGTTYHFPTAYIIWNEFPDMELVGVERLREWEKENKHRLRYQTDTRWNKGKLADQFLSYKKWVGDRTQMQAFQQHMTDNPIRNYQSLWNQASTWHQFGRFSIWFYLQTLKHCAGINLDAVDLLLGDKAGSRAHRNGLCYALGRDELVDANISCEMITELEDGARELLIETKKRFSMLGGHIDLFAMETVCCSFYKLFRDHKTRYLGYYLDRQAQEIRKVEQDNWIGIDWQPFWDCREESLDDEHLVEFQGNPAELTLENKMRFGWEREIGLDSFFA